MNTKTLELAVRLDLAINFIKSLNLNMTDEAVMDKVGDAMKTTLTKMPKSVSTLDASREALVQGSCMLSREILGLARAKAVAEKRQEEKHNGIS